MRRQNDEPQDLYDADITPGISDEPTLPKDEDHALDVGALADGGAAMPAHDAQDMDSGIVGAEDRASITGIGAGNLNASRQPS